METFLKIYLPVYLLLYIVISFLLPTYRTWKRTGINPITFGKSDNAHDYIGFVMKLLIAFLFVSVLLFAIGKNWYQYIVPITYLEKSALRILGFVLIHTSLVWISIAQYQMSNSWRIGIDEVNKTELKTKELFSISRNPIFLGVILSVLGVFCIIPNALTFFVALSTYYIIQIQIRLEEEFLEKRHGNNYHIYKLKAKRFI